MTGQAETDHVLLPGAEGKGNRRCPFERAVNGDRGSGRSRLYSNRCRRRRQSDNIRGIVAAGGYLKFNFSRRKSLFAQSQDVFPAGKLHGQRRPAKLTLSGEDNSPGRIGDKRHHAPGRLQNKFKMLRPAKPLHLDHLFNHPVSLLDKTQPMLSGREFKTGKRGGAD